MCPGDGGLAKRGRVCPVWVGWRTSSIRSDEGYGSNALDTAIEVALLARSLEWPLSLTRLGLLAIVLFSTLSLLSLQLALSPLTSPSPHLSLSFDFQGSNATGDCCSKCWNELRKKQGASTAANVAAPMIAAPPSPSFTAAPAVTADDVDTANTTTTITDAIATASSTTTATTTTTASASPTKKKKTKKTNYKNMLANMMEGSGPARDAQKDKESIQKVTGGGAFVKVDKI